MTNKTLLVAPVPPRLRASWATHRRGGGSCYNKAEARQRAYQKTYRQAHKAEQAAYNKVYYQAHKAELTAYQKAYQKAYRQAHKAELLTHQKAYKQTHKTEIAANRQVHKVEIAAYNKVYYQAHKAELATYKKAYKQTHKTEIAARDKAYSQAHPNKMIDKWARRRALKRGVTIEKVSRAVVYERDSGRCHLCGRKVNPKRWHLDHLIPLARGGEHSYLNVAVACPKCNMHKGVKAVAQLRLL